MTNNMNGMYPNGMAMNGMGQPMQPQNAIPHTEDWLTPDMDSLMQKGDSQFNLAVSKAEIARGICNHYWKNGDPAVTQNPDGTWTCQRCHTTFDPTPMSNEDAKMITDRFLDLINLIKIQYRSLPAEAARTYFQMYPFIEKVPKMYELACTDLNRYANANNGIMNNQMGANNPYMMYASLTGTPIPGYGYGVPMGGYPQYGQQPMGAPVGYNPQVNPQYGVPNQPVQQNGMVYGNPLYGQPAQPQVVQNGYQPNYSGFVMDPRGAAAQPVVNSNMPIQPQNAQPAPQASAAPAAPAQPATSNDSAPVQVPAFSK